MDGKIIGMSVGSLQSTWYDPTDRFCMEIDKQIILYHKKRFTSMYVMRSLRSYRFLLTLCFTIGFISFLYRFNLITRKSTIVSLNILSNKINERLLFLKYHFNYINISMLLHRPISNRSPSITYRCREWCGGCKSIK
jgi:hypothetical protein